MISSNNRTQLALLGGLSVAVTVGPAALAQNAVNLGTVQANGGASGTGNGTGASGAMPPASAPYQAPTQAPLNAIQPTSIINQRYIDQNVSPTSNYDTIINIAPSVSTVSPNGPGFMENQAVSIRGFQDGQFNVTFDGIPWGDSNDFTHHTTSYFMAHDIGQAIVDRGPGTASTIGNATFGGTVSILSKDPSSTFQAGPYASFGSFGTTLFGGEVDTGSIAAANGATGFIDAEGLHTDGYLDNAGQNRKNFFTKFTVPVGDNSVLTFVGMYNQVHQYVSLGATKAQINQYGPSIALSSDPTSQSYFGYNYDNINTDFEYAGLKSDLGNGLTLDNKLYTYGYYHHGFNGLDPNGNTPNGTSYGANDVPGQAMHNDYRSFGDVLRLQQNFDFGDIQTGLWVDHQSNSRQNLNVDDSIGMALTPPGPAATIYNIHDSLDTVQPYLQLDWKPIAGLTISPGLKYNFFYRSFDASINQTTGLPLNYGQSFGALTPSVSVNYRFTPQFSAYAQVAEGFLAPNANTFYVANPSQNSDTPQKSWNYQAGGVYSSGRLTLSGDVYYIDFSNLIGSRVIAGNTSFFNQGGVTYKGLEAESTVYIGQGFSLYGNGSLNSATSQQTGQRIANAPDATGALGLLYDRNGVFGSLIEKWVGSRYGDTGQIQGLQPYGVLGASVGYTHVKNDGPAWIPGGTIRLVADNLLDTHVINGLAGYTADNTPLYWTVPGRSFFASASLNF